MVAASAPGPEGVFDDWVVESFEAALFSDVDVVEFFSVEFPEQLASRTAATRTGRRFLILLK